MACLLVDGREVTFEPGSSVLEALRASGYEIPGLCYDATHDVLPHGESSNSCMVCLVAVGSDRRMVPSCSFPAKDGLVVSLDPGLIDRRRESLEFLLSEHRGDCEAPCSRICPLSIDIPSVIRAVNDKFYSLARATITAASALPRTAESICTAPCERGCRRGRYDRAVNIRSVMCGVIERSQTAGQKSGGKRVAVFGADAVCVGAAHAAVSEGYLCEVFGTEDTLADCLTASYDELGSKTHLLTLDIDELLSAGVTYMPIDKAMQGQDFAGFSERFDVVLIGDGVQIDIPGAFEIGPHEVPSTNPFLHELRRGRNTFSNVFANGKDIFDSHLALNKDDISLYAQTKGAYLGTDIEGSDYVHDAKRCFRCDCIVKADCPLRQTAESLGASDRVYHRIGHGPFEFSRGQRGFVFEPGKCVKCGACVVLSKTLELEQPVVFKQRGYETVVASKNGVDLTEAIRGHEESFASACPTGAMAMDFGMVDE